MAMHLFSVAQTEGGGGNSTGVRPVESTSVVGHLAAPNKARSRPIILPVVCAVALITAIAAGTSILLFHFRDRALADSERELTNTALILAEQSDQAFQAIDVVEKSLIERMKSHGIISSEALERQMSGQDVHLTLKDKISGLPDVEDVSLFNSEGNLINFGRFWPIPALNVADLDYFKALKFDAHLTSVVSAPVLNPTTGTWTVYLARKITGPNGEFLGAVTGGLALQYFENFFGTIALGSGSAIALFRRDGVLLVRHPRREAPGTSFAQGELFKNVLSHTDHGTVRLTSPIDGQERLIAGHVLANYPIVVAVGMTVAAALADWQHEAKILIGAGILAAFVILVFAILIALRLLERDKQFKQWLGQQKFILDMAVNNMSHGLLMFDSTARLVLCNQRFIEMYNLSPEVVKPGCTLNDLLNHRKETGFFAGNPQQVRSEILAGIARGKRTSKSIETTDGRTIYIVDEPMTNGWWVSTHEDITERRRVEVERDRSEKFLNTIVENVPAPIFVKEAGNRRYVLVNEAAEKFLGASRADMIGKTSHEIFSKKEADLIAARDEQLLQSRQPLFEERQILTPRNGTRTIVSKRLVVCDDDGKVRYVVGVIEDVTERKRAEVRIAHLAHHDALTDLPNRVHFAGQLKQALTRLRRGERLAVLYIDLDHFKGVNDTLGHAIGDELLKGVADRLRGCAREIASIARLSGDEFAIIQTSIEQPSDAAALAMQIRDAIKAPYDLNGHRVAADSSIGISIAPNDSTEPNELLKAADMALYEAKTIGRGTYCFYEPEMDGRIKARSKLELDLRTALANSEFELFYQPIVDLQNGRISTCEALLRWRHPDRGVISAAEFIPFAEEIGIINQLGEWVLRTACAEAATWPDNVSVAVNFSSRQLTSNNTVQAVISTLAASGVQAHRLELEIAESVFMQNTFATLATLHQLRELGVRIAMDDFGTGFSSLSYLLSFPFNKIKIDRCFIRGLAEEDNSRAIVRAAANLAASLGMITTAEGVETEQQLDQIRLLGCTEMQGYLFSPPRPAAEIFQLLLSHVDGAVGAA